METKNPTSYRSNLHTDLNLPSNLAKHAKFANLPSHYYPGNQIGLKKFSFSHSCNNKTKNLLGHDIRPVNSAKGTIFSHRGYNKLTVSGIFHAGDINTLFY